MWKEMVFFSNSAEFTGVPVNTACVYAAVRPLWVGGHHPPGQPALVSRYMRNGNQEPTPRPQRASFYPLYHPDPHSGMLPTPSITHHVSAPITNLPAAEWTKDGRLSDSLENMHNSTPLLQLIPFKNCSQLIKSVCVCVCVSQTGKLKYMHKKIHKF